MTWIYRGFMSFVRVKNLTKANRMALHWAKCGGGGIEDPTIGLFEASRCTTHQKG